LPRSKGGPPHPFRPGATGESVGYPPGRRFPPAPMSCFPAPSSADASGVAGGTGREGGALPEERTAKQDMRVPQCTSAPDRLDRRQKMIPDQRREHILKLLQERNVLSISELTSMLSVSHMTVRRDIQALENEGKVLSVTGGVRLAA